MKNKHNKGNHSTITWEDRYYDGCNVDYCEEDFVSSEMKLGTEECIKYIEDTVDNETLWLKNKAQHQYYREPYKPKSNVYAE